MLIILLFIDYLLSSFEESRELYKGGDGGWVEGNVSLLLIINLFCHYSKEDAKAKKERERKEKELQKKKEKDEQKRKREEERREREDKKKKEEERRKREKMDKDLKKAHKVDNFRYIYLLNNILVAYNFYCTLWAEIFLILC